MLIEERYDFFVMFFPRPIALEFEQHLQRSHGNTSGLLDYEDLMENIELHAGDKITKDLKRQAPR